MFDGNFDDLTTVRTAFAEWRATRAHKRAAIPEALWEQAVSLLDRYPLSRVAGELGLNPTHLGRRRKTPQAPEISFVRFSPSSLSLRIERPDGTRVQLEVQAVDWSALPALMAAVGRFAGSRSSGGNR